MYPARLNFFISRYRFSPDAESSRMKLYEQTINSSLEIKIKSK